MILGASLLFLVQPLIAKIILPWFGGSSAVWSAALMFFQLGVLGGYAYAHVLTRYTPAHVQRLLHATLLIAGCLMLPILPDESWRAVSGAAPTLRIFLLLLATVGLPTLLLCSTSPLLQVWYMRAANSEPPYWMFAWSNFGSMAALLSFPFLLEPWFDVRTLAWGWSALFVVFASLCGLAAWMSRSALSTPIATPNAPRPTLGAMAFWVLLAGSASGLLVTITAHLSTNVAPIPLLWVAPLALYLLTFIVAFAKPRLYRRATLFPWVAASLGAMAYLYVHADSNLHIQYVIPLLLAALFIVCFACHGELALRRPSGAHLTQFYLLIAFGGALGGVFVAVLAPHAFETYLELPLLLIVVAVWSVALQWRRRGSQRTLWPVRVAMLGGVVALTGYVALAELKMRAEQLVVQRSFYGVLRVRDELVGMDWASRNLVHGTISHGDQFLTDDLRYTAGSYFSKNSGVGRALQVLQDEGPVRYGVIGLGAGVLSSYARRGDVLRLYELNPDVVHIAHEQFSFLSHAAALGADVGVLVGDARLVLERQPRQRFDLLAVDAFSSDAIPTHLLTKEAVRLYFEHLKSDGVLAIHISNRYLDLTPVCARAAEHVNRSAVVVRTPADGRSSASVWVLITAREGLLDHAAFTGAAVQRAAAPAGFHGWSDDYSSIWPVLDLGFGFEAGGSSM